METAPTFYDQLAQWSEIVGGFAFIVVAILLFRKYVLPAVQAGQIAGNATLVAAETRRETLRADVVKARAELEAADRDAHAIKERGVDDAARERERLLAEANADRERTLANAHAELGRSRSAAQAQLRAELIDRALQLARSRAESRIDATVNARLVHGTVDALLASGSGRAA